MPTETLGGYAYANAVLKRRFITRTLQGVRSSLVDVRGGSRFFTRLKIRKTYAEGME